MLLPVTPDEAANRLKATSLRDFGAPMEYEERIKTGNSYRNDLGLIRLPVLMRYSLELIDIRWRGPGEKVAWWVDFTYKGYACELAHQKFGVRLFVQAPSEDEAQDIAVQVTKKLKSAVRVVEKVIVAAAPAILDAGNATVVNQHRALRRAYDYFRERAQHPEHVDDVRTEYPDGGEGFAWASSFLSGANVMKMNASHDLVAAMTAFLSSLEHDLVLAFSFCDFDPETESLTDHIRSRWGEKWSRIIDKDDKEGRRLHARLLDVVERWRNPYAHGGFEKGQGATVYLHTPGIGALPIGLTSVGFALASPSETDIEGVFALFDEIDAFMSARLPHAMQWIESGLDVQFDVIFRASAIGAISTNEFDKLIEFHEYQWAMHANMELLGNRLESSGVRTPYSRPCRHTSPCLRSRATACACVSPARWICRSCRRGGWTGPSWSPTRTPG